MLAKGELRELFIEELGWDRHTATLKVIAEGLTLELHDRDSGRKVDA